MSWWRKGSTATADQLTADNAMPLIRLEGISKVFKGDADEETWALKDITLDITRGEYVSVSGPSGCGKSTFLAVLALLDTPSSGRYWLNGKLTERLTPAEKTRARSLDSKSGESLMELFGELHADGATVCVATHDPRWLVQAQRHIYLFDGQLAHQPG